MLKRRMEAIPEFAEFVSVRKKERREAEVKALGEAVSLASKHQRFLQKQIAEDVTSPNTAVLATFFKEHESALRDPDLTIITNLNDRLKKLVAEKGLTDPYEVAMSELENIQKKQNGEVEGTNQDSAEAHITARNRFLLDGDLGDWVLLFNARTGPHVARNIRGDIVFEGKEADTCFLHSPTGTLTDMAEILDGFGPQARLADAGMSWIVARGPAPGASAFHLLLMIRRTIAPELRESDCVEPRPAAACGEGDARNEETTMRKLTLPLA